MRATSHCPRVRTPAEWSPQEWWSAPSWKRTAPVFAWEKEFRAASQSQRSRNPPALVPFAGTLLRLPIRLGWDWTTVVETRITQTGETGLEEISIWGNGKDVREVVSFALTCLAKLPIGTEKIGSYFHCGV